MRVATDTFILAAVKSKLAATDIDSVSTVHVALRNGTIVLRGHVRTAGDRARLARAAREVNGVKAVDDELAVDAHLRGPQEQTRDLALVARLDAALAAQTGINAFHLHVSADGGVVRVRGRVPSAALKETALQTIRKTPGVTRVIDEIRVGT